MTHRTFVRCLYAVAGLIALAVLPTGAVMGVFFGFGAAMFLALPAGAIAKALTAAGIPATFGLVMIGIAAAYALVIVAMVAAAAAARQQGRIEKGRALTARAAFFAAVPLVGYLSVNTMAAAWP